MNLKKYMDFLNENDSFVKKNNIRIIDVGVGYSKAVMEIDGDSLNFMGTVHGGAIMTLADAVAGTCIAHNGRNCVTLSASGNFIKAPCEGNLYAFGREVGIKNDTAISDIEIRDSMDNLVFKGMYNMFLIDKKYEF